MLQRSPGLINKDCKARTEISYDRFYTEINTWLGDCKKKVSVDL